MHGGGSSTIATRHGHDAISPGVQIMTQDIHPILLCGGAGTRLWPLSRKSYPKQFARITGTESLFQASACRMSGAGFAAPFVITGSDFRFIVTEQLAAVEMAACGHSY